MEKKSSGTRFNRKEKRKRTPLSCIKERTAKLLVGKRLKVTMLSGNPSGRKGERGRPHYEENRGGIYQEKKKGGSDFSLWEKGGL